MQTTQILLEEIKGVHQLQEGVSNLIPSTVKKDTITLPNKQLYGNVPSGSSYSAHYTFSKYVSKIMINWMADGMMTKNVACTSTLLNKLDKSNPDTFHDVAQKKGALRAEYKQEVS